MKLLFIHQNFPGQYKLIVPRLAQMGGHEIVCLGDEKNLKGRVMNLPGVRLMAYPEPQGAGGATHHYVRNLEACVRRGQSVVRALLKLREDGFVPDVVCAHSGWGESLFVKDIFPEAKLLAFMEFYYRARGSDVAFDPEFPSQLDDLFRVRIKNAAMQMSLTAMDWGVTPTRWQWQQQPVEYRDRISVIHDGIDTDLVRPDPNAVFTVPERGLTFRPGDDVVTFVNRNLEPYRGFHTFMRALPEMQRRRPGAHFLVVGGDEVSYGKAAPEGTTYRQIYSQEVAGRVDFDRVHFLGRIAYDRYLAMLQVSACHVYLTYPFVLSWSMLESMAAGCALVGSATPPVQEVLRDGENGLLVDFFSPDALAATVERVLADPDRMAGMRAKARETVVRDYDLNTVCLPRHVRLIEDLAAGRLGREGAAAAPMAPALRRVVAEREARLRNKTGR
ncbi:MAG TPA: glycosyltransferase family 4 protein [Azospirillaceae bacterium]|nr:glycosyltransferase family 4 protein [Azospirillaceae bacterium]